MGEFIFKIRKTSIEANTPEELLQKVQVEVRDAKQNQTILRAVSIIEVMEKLGGNGNGSRPRPPGT